MKADTAIDVSYAQSRLSGYSGSWISGTIEKIVAEQKARIGRFFTFQRLLLNLRDRSKSIMSVDSSRGKSLLGRVESALANQSTLEKDGIALLSGIGNIKSNPITNMMITQDYEDIFSADLIQRGENLISDLKNMLSQSNSLDSALSDHEGNVARLEKDIIATEGDLSQRGILRKGITASTGAITGIFKSLAIPLALGIGGYLVLTQVTKKGKSRA